MNPEQSYKEAIEALTQAAIDTSRRIVEGIASIIKSDTQFLCEVARQYGEVSEAFTKYIAPAKWWHFYNHAKKARVRKKYYNRIMKLLSEVQTHDC